MLTKAVFIWGYYSNIVKYPTSSSPTLISMKIQDNHVMKSYIFSSQTFSDL